MEHMPFKGKVVIITGVTRGIGRACALQFSKAGATIAGIYLSNDAAATEVSQRVQEHGGLIHLYKGSVFDRDFVLTTFKDVFGTFGRVDVLVNNAGIGMRTVNPRFLVEPQPFFKVTPEGFRDLIDINLTGYFLVARGFAPLMMEQGH